MIKNFFNKISIQRVPAWVLTSGCVVVLAYLYIGGEYGLLEHYKLNNKKHVLVQNIDALQFEQDSLRLMISRLQADSSYMAKIAREKFDMGFPDEEILRVVFREN